MSELSIVTWVIGLLTAAGGVMTWLFPAQTRSGWMAFPRSVWPGRLLAAGDLIWAAYEFTLMHLGLFDAWKVHLYWLTPIAIFLCITYLDDLLSPRALGGFLLLVAGPVLDIARWHPSDWRLVIAILAYLWILIGLLFLLSPWWFRRITIWLTGRGDGAVRFIGALNVLFGLGLMALAFFVYARP